MREADGLVGSQWIVPFMEMNFGFEMGDHGVRGKRLRNEIERGGYTKGRG